MNLAKNINKVLETIPKSIQIVAATKYVESEDMKKLFEVGIKDFGENRVNSFLKKYEALKTYQPCWHFIGHLQTNKAKQILPKIQCLHSLDSYRLAQMIEQVRLEPLDCFIEVNMNKEENKNGILIEECENFIRTIKSYSKINILGLMCMTIKQASSIEKKQQFLNLKMLMQTLNKKLNMKMQKLSMGMSDDYLEAISSGTTTIRLGKILWDQQN